MLNKRIKLLISVLMASTLMLSCSNKNEVLEENTNEVIHEIVEELKRKIQGKRDYPAYRQRLEFRVRHPHHCAGNNSGRYTHGEDIRTIFSLCASGAVYNFGSDSGKENVYEKGGVLHYQQLFRTYTGGI